MTCREIVFFIVFYKGIVYSSFDENFYRIYGIPVTFINYFMIILVSSAIIINIKTIGIILIISILTIPQATASIIARKYSSILFLSVFFSFLGILFGLYFSYIFNIPSGPSIIVSLTILLVIVKLFSFFAKKSKNLTACIKVYYGASPRNALGKRILFSK